MGEEGIEPSQCLHYELLKLARLAIPPLPFLRGNKLLSRGYFESLDVLGRLGEPLSPVILGVNKPVTNKVFIQRPRIPITPQSRYELLAGELLSIPDYRAGMNGHVFPGNLTEKISQIT